MRATFWIWRAKLQRSYFTRIEENAGDLICT
jgi:hypothetical protein